MTYPVEIRRIPKKIVNQPKIPLLLHQKSDLEYFCPDCDIPMIRLDKTHSPTSRCFHSFCKQCGLEYCDFYHSYWGKKPINKEVIVIIQED